MPGGDGKKTRPDFLFKFLVIGDANVGKSCLLNQFLEGKFLRHSSHTIGVSFGSKTVENINGKSIKLQIWDTGTGESVCGVCVCGEGGCRLRVLCVVTLTMSI
jgi:small GTP-binding protein